MTPRLAVLFGFLGICLSRYYVPVYVMLPLETIQSPTQLNDPAQLGQWFAQLKSGGVNGILADIWWGMVEQQPKQYVWTAYQQLFQLAQQNGLLIQGIMSFHQCGGNVGDDCNIPLPSWVVNVGNENPDIW